MKTSFLIQIAGLLHIGLIAAGIAMPRVVGLPSHLAGLPEFIRRLVWVYYTFIGFCLLGFGAGSFFLAEPLASGAPLARAVCGFLCIFWTIRLAAALFVLDVRIYLTRPILRLGYHATSAVFALLPIIYGFSAIQGGSP
jgi:hypothetical protein